MSEINPPHRLPFLHRWMPNRSESHLPHTRTGLEPPELENRRSQISLPKPGIFSKIKDLFVRKRTVNVMEQNLHPVNAEQHTLPEGINQSSNFFPSIAVIAPHDEILLHSSNQETSSEQLNAPNLAIVDAAREAASGAISEMSVIAMPVHSATSAINNMDNPIGLVDSVSSFLKTLSKFNGIVDKIATIHPYAQAAWTVLSYASKTIIDQTIRDDSIYSLFSKMSEVYTFLINAELRDIESMKTVVERICQQTLECSYFIREYSEKKKFWTRLFKNLTSDADRLVQKYNNVFDELLQQFRDRAARDTLVVVHRIWKGMEGLEAQVEDLDLNSIPYARGAGLDTRKICLEGTRIEIIDEITAWINNTGDNTPRVFWLHGNAGTGKSSIAHTIAYHFRKLGRLGSCYCFNRNEMVEQRHENIFTTIARDLADHDKQMRRVLVAAVHQDTSLKNTADILQQWKELIMKPAKTLSEVMVGPIVIVIDALDESGGAGSRRHLLRILAGKLDDKESHISNLPPHFRILLTSRPLPDIDNALNGVEHIQCKSMDSIPPALTQSDIARYISCELSGSKEIQSQVVSASLAHASDGLFEWARNKDDRVPLLDSMYKLTLETIFPPNQYMPKDRSTRLNRFRSVMAQILGTAEPLPLTALNSMRRHFKHLGDIDVNVIIRPLGALLSGTTDPSATIRPLHASFPDFLTDENRSGEFFIDFSHIHNDLAFASLGVMKAGLRFNICQLPSSYLPNSEIPDLAERVKHHIHPELTYSCRFWTDHLRHTQFNLPLAEAVREFFNEWLLFWLEALSLLGTINTCASVLSSVIQWVASHAECKDISDDAADAQRFVRMFGGTISFSTPHLYLSALPFSPKKSRISEKFTDKFSNVLRIVGGRNLMTWPVIQGVLHGHSNYVQSVAFSPDGKRIVSGSDDKTIRLWDAETGEQLRAPLKGHEGWVLSVAFSSDGKRIVSGSYDKTIRLWDAETGELLQLPLEGHERSVSSVAFSPDTRRIVSGSSDQTIRLWDAETGLLLQPPLKGHQSPVSSVAFSPDGKRIVSGSFDQTIRLWDAETGLQLQLPLRGHRGPVSSVTFSPDGKYIMSGSDDETVRLWDAEIGEQLQPPLKGHSSVLSVAFSPDGKHIVVGLSDKTIWLWDTEKGKPLQPPLEGHQGSVRSVAFSPDGKRIVSGSHDKTVRLWDAETGDLLQPPLEGHEGWVSSVAFSPGGKRIASGSSDQTIQLWNAKTGELLQPPLKGHQDSVSSVSFSPDSKCMVSGSDDKTIRLWDAETGEPLRSPLRGHQDSVSSVAFSPDGKHIVSGSDDETIRLWDAATGKLLRPPIK